MESKALSVTLLRGGTLEVGMVGWVGFDGGFGPHRLTPFTLMEQVLEDLNASA